MINVYSKNYQGVPTKLPGVWVILADCQVQKADGEILRGDCDVHTLPYY